MSKGDFSLDQEKLDGLMPLGAQLGLFRCCCFTSAPLLVDNNELILCSHQFIPDGTGCQIIQRTHCFKCPPSGSSEVLSHRATVTCRCWGWKPVWSEMGAWFSFLLACGWCNWSRQSEDRMIPAAPPPPPPSSSPPHRDTLISPRLPGSRAVE